MARPSRDSYLFSKRSLLVFLYLCYTSDIPFAKVILRSFGFHFDPRCSFKAIILGEEGKTRKYAVNILQTRAGVNFDSLDIMGNVNIVRVKKVVDEDDLPTPSAALNVYFDGENFSVNGYFAGKYLNFRFIERSSGLSLARRMNRSVGCNSSAESFTLYLMRFYCAHLPIDLVMGAGINKDYGALDWHELVNHLSTSFYKGDHKSQAEVSHYVGAELFTSSNLMMTNGFDTYKALNHELYSFEEKIPFTDPHSTLYKCVDFLSSHPGTSVITYNYDTNLEYLMKKRGLLYCTIYDDNSFIKKDAVASIFHVHGLLPYERFDQTKFTDSLIFNESDYYYLYNNPYSWNIAKQLHDFKFNVCFFIGISLTDPDMKRLLELASNYLKFNFIFLKKEKGYSERVFAEIWDYFFTFDLIVVWVDEYEEIGKWLTLL